MNRQDAIKKLRELTKKQIENPNEDLSNEVANSMIEVLEVFKKNFKSYIGDSSEINQKINSLKQKLEEMSENEKLEKR